MAEDPAVARLQVQVENVNASLAGLRDAQQAQFSALNSRLDTFTDLVRDIAHIQSLQLTHSEGLKRAFDEIRATDANVEQVKLDAAAWQKEHEDVHTTLNTKLNRGIGWLSGVAAILTLLSSFGLWLGSRVIDKLDATEARTYENATKLLEYKLQQAENVHKGE